MKPEGKCALLSQITDKKKSKNYSKMYSINYFERQISSYFDSILNRVWSNATYTLFTTTSLEVR